jgi:signal transduction histidine kinase
MGNLVRALLVGCVLAQAAFYAPAPGIRAAYLSGMLGGLMAYAMLQVATGPVIEALVIPLELDASAVLFCMVLSRRGGHASWWIVAGLMASIFGLAICGFWLVQQQGAPPGNGNTFTLRLLFLALLAPAARSVVERRGAMRQRPARASDASGGYSRRALESAVDQERQRIAQDLHDSLGTQLVYLIARQDCLLPDQRRTSEFLNECLVELHLAVDRFHDNGSSLSHSLGGLRYRVQPALDRMGIHLDWDVQDGEGLGTLQPEHSLALLRIAQEALSNVLRHSKATCVFVGLQMRGGLLCLEICDNGLGLAPDLEAHRLGKGLSGMRARACAMGAEFHVTPGKVGGTRVYLRYPLGRSH